MNDNKENNNINKSKTEKVLILLTILLTISQIFNIFYSIYSKVYTSLDKFLIRINMVLFSLAFFLLIILTSFLAISIILRCLILKKDEYLNITFKKFLLKNIIFFIITCLFLSEFMISVFLYVFYKVKRIDIIIYIMLSFPILLAIFIYAYIEPINKDKIYKDKVINKIIEFISTSKLLTTVLLTYMFIFNLIFCLKIYNLPKELYKFEKQMNIKEQIKYDKEIKYEIMIDRLFEKIDINVTDEDIEEYKNNIKQKYKMEE